VLRDRIEVSNDVVKAFWRWEGQDAMRVTLVSTLEYLDEDGRREADRRALDELSALGLVAGGVVSPELRPTIQALTRPDVEVYGWGGTQQRMVGMLAAARDGVAVLAVADGRAVTLLPARPDGLAEMVVAQLPALAAAHGRAVSVAESDLTGGAAQHRDEGFSGFGQSHDGPDVRILKALMAQPPLGTGKLHVAMRDTSGRRVVSPSSLSYLDLPEGRWMIQVAPNGSGQNWVIAAPGTPQLLVSKLYEMGRALSGVR
jgi:ESX secretion-associated protein EspG